MPMPNMNPMGVLTQLMGMNPQMQNNPQIQNLQRMVQAGDFNGVQNLGQNLCNSYGVDPQDVFNQVKPKIPFL